MNDMGQTLINNKNDLLTMLCDRYHSRLGQPHGFTHETVEGTVCARTRK